MIRLVLIGGAGLALAACGSPGQDRIDNMEAAEGVARTDPAEQAETEPVPAAPVLTDDGTVEDPVEETAEHPDIEAEQSDEPSFSCAGPLNRVEAMICSEPSLARIDRHVAELFDRTMDGADSEQTDRLERVGRRALAERDRCGDPYCVARVYRGYAADIEAIAGETHF